ncbi:hypothetical protein [Salmonirosea aquatica]|uniref:DOT1 domain-containing protein n=1 Tax=Salmonirosea aquatica TaxID=2654236 RepID=A0A7C9BLM0_9BACT|nr:hypothetical protein [Cytophagaceae bacterium SJW1-29]
MMISDLQTDIEALQGNTALWNETNFEKRIEALDDLEFIIDRIEALLQLDSPPVELFPLKQCAQTIKSQLEAINVALFARLRAAIRSGRCQGVALLDLIKTYAGSGLISSQPTNSVVGYSNLDVFTNSFFFLEILPTATLKREPEMVFYQKTPTQIILELVAKANLTNQDVFYDLGSGLGHVCVLVNLLTGTTAKGIEIEPAYCSYATICASDLNLSNVVFICEDARIANYSDGTVFFLYTPFVGQILQEVLNKLQVISWDRPIRLFSYGPCTAYIAQQSWLTSTGQVNDYLYELGEFRSRPTN